MSGVFSVAPVPIAAFVAVNHAAGEAISAAGSMDVQSHLAEVAVALGPFAAPFYAAYGLAFGNHIAATGQLAALHTGIGAATGVASATFVAADIA